MKVFFFTIIFLIVEIAVSAQQIERYVADSLFKILTKEKQGIERIKALNGLAQFYIFKPGENQIDFDSASIYLSEAHQLNQSAKSPSLDGQLLLTESYMVRGKGHRDSAILKLEEAIRTLASSNDKYYLGKTLYELSGYYDYRNDDDFKKKLILVERSVAALDQSNSILEKADALTMLGDLYNVRGNFGKAIEALKRALAAYDSINYRPRQRAYILLGSIYVRRNDYKQALFYELLALKTAESCRDTTMQLCQINSELAVLYTLSAKYDVALKYYKDALTTAIKYEDHYAIALTMWNISRANTQLNQPNESLALLSGLPSKILNSDGTMEKAYFAMSYLATYIATNQSEKSGQYCTLLLDLISKENIPDNIKNIVYRMVADYYLQEKQFSKARFYLTLNKPITEKIRSTRARSSDERLWYKLDSAQKNYESAFYHLNNYRAISDSLFDETKARQFQQLEVEYETTKKEDSLKQQTQHISLLLQRNNLQQTNLKQANLIKNITIVGTILTLIALILLYYQYRKNQRSNKIILQKNEELKDMLAEKEWWLKEVHHRVKNNLHTIICLLESQAMYLEKDALQAIEKSQHRIYAMSLIHQKLYQNEDLQVIDMSVYLEEFIGYLKDSFDTEKINFIIQVDPVQLNLQQAIPVALIINEGVTNAIKYAFENENEPKIWVSMKETNERVKLTIRDNGRGFEMKEENEGKSLGMQLIKGLSKELKGTVRIETTGGTTLNVEFKKGSLTDEMAYVKTMNV